MVGYADLSRH